MGKYRFFFLIISMTFVAYSCNFVPSFDKSPQITFKSIGIYKVNRAKIGPTPSYSDSILISIAYQDGDGDLGLDTTDQKSDPFKPLNQDGTFNTHYKNYHLAMFKKKGQKYSRVSFVNKNASPYGLDIVFIPLNDRNNPTAIKGVLKVYLFIDDAPQDYQDEDNVFVVAGDTIRYSIYIEDRALNRSNEVTTGDVILYDLN